MNIQNLTQGSPEWLAYRAQHFNASDAPAMMGCSPYKTRRQLMHELHTGLAPEVNAATQRRFNEGHRIEALALPLAEAIVKDDLYPVTGCDGRLSASFDGLTMCQATAFEHKTLNDELRAAMVEGCTGADLPLVYQVQMEQQLMVSGAERVLFLATKWDGNELAEERHCWYVANAELNAQIRAGWAQFAEDLAAYMPVALAPAVVATVMESLPAVSVNVQGALAVVSNLPEFATALRAFIAKIPAKPSTDQEFADTENACKALKKAEDALEAAENNALGTMGSVEEMRRMVADLRSLARATRLASIKLVEKQKDQVRLDIVQRGRTALADHLTALNARLGKPYMPAMTADFAGAIKGKRTIDSLNDAVDTLLANTKIEASASADRIQSNLATLRELAAGHGALFPDTALIVLKSPDDLSALVKSRIADYAAKEAVRLETERAKIRQEESDKLLQAQAAAALLVTQEAERAATAAAAIAQAAAAAAAAIAQAATAVPAPVLARAAVPAPARFTAAAPAAASTPPAATEPNLSLGEISARTSLPLSAAFLRGLGFEPAGTRRGAVLFHESEFDGICLAIEAHVRNVRIAQRAEA